MFWGGETKDLNQHHDVPNQAFAVEFLVIDSTGKTHKDDGKWIEHRDHEVSVLAHFQQGSVCVKRGDTVKRGQPLGLCGTSGNSSEPHIHFHLQNTPIIQDGIGMRCLFDRVTVVRNGKGETRTNYSPVKGDIVKSE